MSFALFALSLHSAAASASPASSQPAPSHVEGSPAPSSRPAPSRVGGSGVEGSQAEGDVALIRNSGSTNTLPYTISVKPDGSAVVTVGSGTPEDRRLSLDQTDALFRGLRAAMPLSALVHGHCMRSASFGTTTTVTFGGDSTPDLGCAPDPAARELAATVVAIVSELGLSVMRFHAPPAPQ